MTNPNTPSNFPRWLRVTMVGLAAFAMTIALFYTEEDWRGKTAWEHAKHALEARGEDLNWAHYIPPPVAADENIFGVPQMQKWFVGRGSNDFSAKLQFPGWTSDQRMVVAQLTVGLQGTEPPVGSAAVRYGDPKAQSEITDLAKRAVGDVVLDPCGAFYTLGQADVRPAQIFLQCEKAPTQMDLEKLVPSTLINMMASNPPMEEVHVESTGGGQYSISVRQPSTVAGFVAWNKQFEPEFDLIRQAVQRPYARMDGNYAEPSEMPIPRFVVDRVVAQRLAAMTRCYLALGQSDKALEELTLMHQLCRTLEGRPTGKPMTLIAAMINVAIRGLYVDTIQPGLDAKRWTEPQLAVIEQQCQEINLIPYLKGAMELELVSPSHILVDYPWGKVLQLYYSVPATNNGGRFSLLFWGALLPEGWRYQNAVTLDSLYGLALAGLDVDQNLIYPDKLDAFSKWVQNQSRNPYSFLALMWLPNYNRAFRELLEKQTAVNHAAIACALERYRLQRGAYPEKLDDLRPQLITAIPHDLVVGHTPHYSRSGDAFKLYSVGWDGMDHGGVAGVDLVWPEK